MAKFIELEIDGIKKLFRNLEVAYTDEDIKEATELFKSLPSYDKITDTASSEDIFLFVEQIKWPKSREQVESYRSYWNQLYNGILTSHL